MEFTKLSEVEVVETANDTDKVLIEQNGEIKRVPKTEVGGGGGNVLIVDATVDLGTMEIITTNTSMTLDETVAALGNLELTGVVFRAVGTVEGQVAMSFIEAATCMDYTMEFGAPAILLACPVNSIQLLWTADGFEMDF